MKNYQNRPSTQLDQNLKHIRSLLQCISATHEMMPGTNIPTEALLDWEQFEPPLEGLQRIYEICTPSPLEPIRGIGNLAALTYCQISGVWILMD